MFFNPLLHKTDKQLEEDLKKDNYNGFLLTKAVRLDAKTTLLPENGFKLVWCQIDKNTRERALLVCASREILWDLFIDFVSITGSVTDVCLESSHHSANHDCHTDFIVEEKEVILTTSTFFDFQDILLNDGCTGIAVYNGKRRVEVQLCEHKFISIYGWKKHKRKIKKILEKYGIPLNKEMSCVVWQPHMHVSSTSYAEEFKNFKIAMGADSYDSAI